MANPAVATKAIGIARNLVRGSRTFLKGVASTSNSVITSTGDKIKATSLKIKNENLSQRRKERDTEELERRKGREKNREGGIVPAATKIVDVVVKKPLASLWKLIAAWAVDNLPWIIKQVEIFIKKVKVFTGSVKRAITSTGATFKSLGKIMNAFVQNIKEFDFTDKSGRIATAKEELDENLEGISESVGEMWTVWGREEEELDYILEKFKADESIEKIRSELDKEFKEEEPVAKPKTPAFGSQASGSSGSGAKIKGTAEEYRIAAAIATEAGRGVSATDVLQVGANRVADDRYPNNFTDVFAQPDQFQGVFDRGIGKYRKIKTAEDAAAFSGRSVEQINGYIADMRNSGFRADSAKEIRGALEFRAAPGYYKKRPSERPTGTGADGRIPGSSWRGGSGDNQILRDPSKGDPMRAGGAAPINYPQGGTLSSSDIPTPKEKPPNVQAPRPAASSGTSTVKDEFMGGKSTKIVTTSKYGMRNHPTLGGYKMHNGIDLAPPGAGYRVALKASGKVTRVDFDPRGYGNFVIITSKETGKSYMFAHLKSVYVKNGDSYTGQAIGEIGSTGTSTGIHLHYEVYIGGKDGKAINPEPYLNLISIGKKISRQETAAPANGNSALSSAKNMFLDTLSSIKTGGEKIINNTIVMTQKEYIEVE